MTDHVEGKGYCMIPDCSCELYAYQAEKKEENTSIEYETIDWVIWQYFVNGSKHMELFKKYLPEDSNWNFPNSVEKIIIKYPWQVANTENVICSIQISNKLYANYPISVFSTKMDSMAISTFNLTFPLFIEKDQTFTISLDRKISCEFIGIFCLIGKIIRPKQ